MSKSSTASVAFVLDRLGQAVRPLLTAEPSEVGVNALLGEIPRQVLMFPRDDYGGLRPTAHHRLVWMLLLGGRGGVLVDGRLVELRRGQSMLILPYQSHRRMRWQTAGQWLLATFELSDPSALEIVRGRVILEDHENLVLMRQMLEAYRGGGGPGENQQADVPLLLARVLQRVVRRFQITRGRGGRTGVRQDDPALHRAVALMSKHVQEPLRVWEVCERLALSKSQLRKLVREGLGLTPKQLMLEMKMQHAVQMLSLEGVGVKQAALRLGFSSPYAFSKMFHRVIGRTPKSYKQARALPPRRGRRRGSRPAGVADERS